MLITSFCLLPHCTSHLYTPYLFFFFLPFYFSKQSQIQTHHLDLFGSARSVSDGAVSYLNELWLTEAWPSLERESDRDSTQAPVQPIIILPNLNQAVCGGQQYPVCLKARRSFNTAPPPIPPWGVHLPAASFSCVTLSSPCPCDIFCTWIWGALVFGEERRSEPASSTFSQLLTAAWFNAVELRSQHLFVFMPQPQKWQSLRGDLTVYLFLFSISVHPSAYC